MALPDYPALKQEICNMLLLIVQQGRDAQMGPFDQSPRTLLHEGDTSTYATVDGQVRRLEPKAFRVESTVTLTDLPRLTHEDVVRLAYSYGTQFGEQVGRSFMADLDATLEAAGRTANMDGRPLDGQMLLELFEDLEIDFDDSGKPRLPTFLSGNPAHGETIRRLMTEDQIFIAQFASLLERKKEQWVERESHRKLVD
jgi:hypothetical protein